MQRLTVAIIVAAAASAGSGAAAKTFYQDLHDFAGGAADGDTPYAELVADGQGRLYGTTYLGGAFGGGTVFRITLPTGKTGPASFELLHSFQSPEGVTPEGGVLIGADGGIYGTTLQGGAHSGGTVFRLDPATLALTDLHDFNAGATPPDGNNPVAGLIAGPGGLLYGTARANGPLGGGTVFAISPRGDTVSYATIHSFGASGDGNAPYGRLVRSGNNLFGITHFGGSFNGFGTAYELTLAKGGAWTESGLYQFGTSTADAVFPANGLAMAKSGTLYGCAPGGSFGQGAAFSITPGTGGAPMQEAVIYNFGGNAGDPYPNPSCGLTIDKTGRLVGTSSGGGSNLSGTVFTLQPGGGAGALGVRYSFGIRANGDAVGPDASLIGVKGGYYVGTTPVGGAHDKGAVFRVKF